MNWGKVITSPAELADTAVVPVGALIHERETLHIWVRLGEDLWDCRCNAEYPDPTIPADDPFDDLWSTDLVWEDSAMNTLVVGGPATTFGPGQGPDVNYQS